MCTCDRATGARLPGSPNERRRAPLAHLDIVVLGLSITSSWGNGHATTYRALCRALADRGHRILFLERDVPWYAPHRDLPNPAFCSTYLYESVAELRETFEPEVAAADLVIVGSYVPDGGEVGAWVNDTAGGITAFYDIDTPITLAALDSERCDYLTRNLIGRYDLLLSFTGGPVLERLHAYGARMARPLYCSVDPALYAPQPVARDLDLGYMGTYSLDRQPKLERLLLEPARRWPAGRFEVAGPLYPDGLDWPTNVHRREHVPPSEHAGFYSRQRFTLNLTRADMIATGYAPSVRLFEAAACGTPIISDRWPGLDTLFEIGREILIVDGPTEVETALRDLGEEARRAIGEAGRRRVLAGHTAARRAQELEAYLAEAEAAARRQTA
jgi:spore maturation protein CgeB